MIRLPFYVISYCESYTSSSVHRSDRAVSPDVSISQLSPVTSDGPTHSDQSAIRNSSTTSVPQQKRVSRPQRRLRCVASSSSSTEEVIHEEEEVERGRRWCRTRSRTLILVHIRALTLTLTLTPATIEILSSIGGLSERGIFREPQAKP